jgi:hypothetical protein
MIPVFIEQLLAVSSWLLTFDAGRSTLDQAEGGNTTPVSTDVIQHFRINDDAAIAQTREGSEMS